MQFYNKTDSTTRRDGEHEETAEPASSHKSALTESPTVGQHKQDERASRDLNQPKYKLGEIEVRAEPGHPQREAVVHQHVDKPGWEQREFEENA